ncbi:MAG: NIPSNAP family protein [Telluria sp.]
MEQDFGVIELRRYTIQPGRRADFARYFETYFPEAFQQLGAIAFGQFFERARPNCFAWLRGFRDMDARLAVNRQFYHGPVWAEHKPAVNSLIVDSDDVLLLRPAFPGSGLTALRAVDAVNEGRAHGVAVVQLFKVAPEHTMDAFLRRAELAFACYRGRGVTEAGVLATLDEPNNFPQHPIRTDGPWVVWIGMLEDEKALQSLRPMLEANADALAEAGLLAEPAELAVFDPTPRSRLRWSTVQRQFARAA